MNVQWQRKAALAFWALVVLVVELMIRSKLLATESTTSLDGWGLAALRFLLPIAIGLELFAFIHARRSPVTARSGWLLGASALTALTAVLFILPSLIQEVYGDRIYACWLECGDEAYNHPDATNLGEAFFWMYLSALATAAGALIAWTVYVVQTLRRRNTDAVQVSQT